MITYRNTTSLRFKRLGSTTEFTAENGVKINGRHYNCKRVKIVGDTVTVDGVEIACCGDVVIEGN